MFLRHSITYLKNLKKISRRSFSSKIDINREVQNALKHNEAVVALESTIITHGMPYPSNLETALEVEEIVRKNNAVPATIAILNGRIKVGVSRNELEYIAKDRTKEIIKCSRRDLPYVVAERRTGGTTVAGTMIIAQMAGIKVFATGGIGGVHFQGQDTMDVSADLVELGRTPVAVVCSGVKSILDIPRTLEYLETQGVCVATYGDANKCFPDFYTRDSGCKVQYNLDSAQMAANLIQTLHDLNMRSGILIAVPIPEKYAADKNQIQAAIAEASKDAMLKGIHGKEVTPFLLGAIARITQGKSLSANIALIKNNAAVAAKIAYKLCSGSKGLNDGILGGTAVKTPTPVIIGASILDMALQMSDELPNVLNGATYQISFKHSAGGVGRNLAEGIFKLHGSAKLVSIVGNDLMGKTLLDLMPKSMRSDIYIEDNTKTSMCSVLIDKVGECKLVLGNMEIHKKLTTAKILQNEHLIAAAPLVVIDANLSVDAIKCILTLAQNYQKPVFYEPTDMRIADKPFQNVPENLRHQIKLMTPNIYELKKIVETIVGDQLDVAGKRTLHMTASLNEILDYAKELLIHIHDQFDCIVVTLGKHGVLVSLRGNAAFDGPMFDMSKKASYLLSTNSDDRSQARFRHYPAPHIENIKNVSGAGDSFCSGLIATLLKGKTLDESVAFGFLTAQCSMRSESAVPMEYDLELNGDKLQYADLDLQSKAA